MRKIESLIGAGRVACALGALFLIGCGSAEDPGTATLALSEQVANLPPLPSASIAVPGGNHLAFVFEGVGVQMYTCKAAGAGYAWTFVAPDATLEFHDKAVGHHFAGPTWEYRDGSTVVGAKVAGTTPDPTAIPWLLLHAVSHAGDGRMTDVTYIQRLATVGGIAPAGGCDASSVGKTADVPYTATYAFFVADDE